MIDEDSVRERNASSSPHLDERSRRLFAASEAKAAGYGGIAAVSRITGRAASTIGLGLKDLSAPLEEGRVRRRGGGRKPLIARPEMAASRHPRRRDIVTIEEKGGASAPPFRRPQCHGGRLQILKDQPPPLARIDAVEWALSTDSPADCGFHIVSSRAGEVHTAVGTDAATCPACLGETLDLSNRRYRYPFTNCTHCGPRLSIVRAVPYDRCNTSMAAFSLCPGCRAEYKDPDDRRFHAQPTACPSCGPHAWLERFVDGRTEPQGLTGCDAVEAAKDLLLSGSITAQARGPGWPALPPAEWL